MKRLLFTWGVFLLVFYLLIPIAFAKEPATPELTMQQAVARAIIVSNALKSAKYDIDRGYEVRQFAADKVKYIPTGPATPEAEMAFQGLLQADLSWQMAKKIYATQEDTIIMAVYQNYYRVKQAQEKVNAAKLAVESADWQYRMTVLGHQVGVASRQILIQARCNLAGAKANMEAGQQSLEDAYQKFNQLVGLWPEDRPVLVDRPAFSLMAVDNLYTETERAIEGSPTVWLTKRNIDLARISLNLYNFADPYRKEPYEARKIDVNKAEVSFSDIRDQTKKLVRTLFYTIRQLEEQYAGTEESVKVAEESLRVVQVKYRVGMATRAEVVTAEASLSKAEQALLDLTCQHEVLKLTFRKPWTFSTTSVNY